MYGKEYLEEMEIRLCVRKMREAVEEAEAEFPGETIRRARLILGTHLAPKDQSLAYARQQQQALLSQQNPHYHPSPYDTTFGGLGNTLGGSAQSLFTKGGFR